MDEPRLISIGRPTASGVVCKGPCLLYSICGIGLAQASNVYTVYDGQTTGGKVMFRLVAGAYATDFRLYACPIYFSRGLYIDFTTNGEEVSLQYLQLKS